MPTFYSKINDSSKLRTTRFSSSRFGVRVTVVPNIFTIYPQHFSIPEISETEGLPYEFFRQCETKNFRRKILILPPPPLIQTFSLPVIFWNTVQKGSPMKFFGTVRQQIFDGKSRYYLPPPTPPPPPSLLSIKFFETRNFLKQKGSSTKWFGSDTKQFWRKIVISAPSLIPNIFRHQKFSETQKGSSTKFFGTVRQKFFNGKLWYPFA